LRGRATRKRSERPQFVVGDRVCSAQLFIKHAIVDKVVYLPADKGERGYWAVYVYEDIHERERGLLLKDRNGFLQYDPLYQMAKVMCE
jgi:hypothetical protein